MCDETYCKNWMSQMLPKIVSLLQMNNHLHNPRYRLYSVIATSDVANFGNLLLQMWAKWQHLGLWKITKIGMIIYCEHTSYLYPLVIQWRMLYIKCDTGEANSNIIKMVKQQRMKETTLKMINKVDYVTFD